MKMLAITAAFGLLTLAGEAIADPMGREPYAFPSRSGSVAVQLQMLKKNAGSSSTSSSGSSGSSTQYVTNYTTTSTSIGNLNEITQILDNGAQGYIGNSVGQTSSGNQGSTSTSSVTTATSP